MRVDHFVPSNRHKADRQLLAMNFLRWHIDGMLMYSVGHTLDGKHAAYGKEIGKRN